MMMKPTFSSIKSSPPAAQTHPISEKKTYNKVIFLLTSLPLKKLERAKMVFL